MGLFLCSRYDIIERSTECGQHNSNMHRTLFYFCNSSCTGPPARQNRAKEFFR